ncbi:hypothetical protein LEP1GSC132_2298 [Leptospira kirschneri str. 200803703]|uniref:Uncharacterized protein n=2 Tax=Leptospira kirschneri TaxID=29507 RepID=A0A0E2AXS8_9LEPT|nr:hypothetical protein LEP1GSC044_0762 [Leptospira kirschneri serovar Grippotyphosa str. RM52]EKO13737.1 hypothetical protein LEP1GSC081_3078 [Leptospira kirschneri str. H1]EKO51921.1 hypothetical protein LEP1GSC131_1353 [Leptospira kirschneri str. 200802841]EKQ83256.1 hypothetical protein LEP1GSC064_1198 [Leptospira kirschneri serovar Grippotyphosa str. Moskva]EKR07948.1 hypothetical protein LEP1GSC122_2217 [Leptospira kirschneri serovar Valbuzzi str. 200702274]EMK00723.1 hypothetical protei
MFKRFKNDSILLNTPKTKKCNRKNRFLYSTTYKNCMAA